MKKFLVVILSIAMALSTVACGAENSDETKSDSTEKSEGGQEDITLSISMWDYDMNPDVKSIIAAYEVKNPHITIEVQDTPSADFTQKLTVQLNGGAGSDIIAIKDAASILAFYNKGQVENLTPYIEKDNYDLEGFSGMEKNFVLEDGAVMGLPFRNDHFFLYYNKDIFDAASVDYPTNEMTWMDFEETAKLITTGEGTTKKYGGFLQSWGSTVYNWSLTDGENTIFGPDYDFFKPFYEMALRMQNVDETIPAYADLKAANIHYSSPFLQGNLGMMPMGTWFMSTIIDKVKSGESDVNWGVVRLPYMFDGLEDASVGAATPFAINSSSDYKEEVWEFISFATSEEAAKIIAETGKIPARKTDEILQIVANVDGMPEGVAEALHLEVCYPDIPMSERSQEVIKMLQEEHGMIMLGEIALDDGLANMEERVKEILGD